MYLKRHQIVNRKNLAKYSDNFAIAISIS